MQQKTRKKARRGAIRDIASQDKGDGNIEAQNLICYIDYHSRGSVPPKKTEVISLDITSNEKTLISNYMAGRRDVLRFRLEGVGEILKVKFCINKI
ncbi:MAG: hypothetical protein LBL45_04890 [Treponema sp.]|jgi:hypothetical protein|nr:hypothetical protein [Treponema sp.]